MVPGPPRQWSGAQRQLWPGQKETESDPLRCELVELQFPGVPQQGALLRRGSP